MSKQQVVDEIHKGARKNFNRRCVILKGIDDLWQGDLIDMQKHAKDNKGFKYILIIIDSFSKYAWCVPVKSKTKSDITHAFESILKEGRIPSNLQTDLGKEFYNDLFQLLMKTYKINHYSSYSTKKASIVERLIRTIKNKLYKHFSLAGNYKWIGKPLNDIVNLYNNTMHRTIKYKPNNVNTYNQKLVMKNIECSRKPRMKRAKLKIGDHVRISKYKSDFHKGYTPNWSTEIFKVIKINKTIPVTYKIEDQRKQPILGTFYEQELQKTKYPDVYLIEKVLKKKGDKIFVKWLGLSSNENCWIHKNAIV